MKIELGTSQFGVPFTHIGNPNFHIAITGTSGQGKTTLLKKLTAQLPAQSARGFIFDVAGDFASEVRKGNFGGKNVPIEVIPIQAGTFYLNPFLPQIPKESFNDIADRICNMIRANLGLGDTQCLALGDAIVSGLEARKLLSFSDLYTWLEERSNISKDVLNRLCLKIKKLERILPGDDIPYDWELDIPRLTILDLSKVRDTGTQSMLVELLLADIIGPRMAGDLDEKSPIVCIFDEAQRIRFREDCLVNRILREGRKYGVHGWFSTQFVDKKSVGDVLGQAALQIIFRPQDKEMHKIACMMAAGDRGKVSAYEKRLAALRRGDFLYLAGNKINQSNTWS